MLWIHLVKGLGLCNDETGDQQVYIYSIKMKRSGSRKRLDFILKDLLAEEILEVEDKARVIITPIIIGTLMIIITTIVY